MRHPSRACGAAHPDPQATAVVCALCRLYVTNQRYRALWDGLPVPPRSETKSKSSNIQTQALAQAEARQLECAHLGDALDKRGCDCRWKWVHECDLLGRCTRGDPSLGLPVCNSCADYSAEPIDKIKPDGILRIDSSKLSEGAAHFNCSILEWQGKTLLAYRTDWIGSTIHIAELGSNWLPLTTTPVCIQHPLAEGSAEDPRLFTFQEQLWLSFTGARIAGNGIEASQLLAQLDPGYQPWCVLYPEFAARQWPMEKNWVYFEHGGRLHAVYSIAPHQILRIEDARARLAHVTTPTLLWAGGLLRGGAPPVLYNGEWYCFFHGAKDTKDRRIYSIGCYTFEDKPPFAITRLTQFPILIPEGQTKPPANKASVAFPCGAIRRNRQWVVSYGLHDEYCELAFFDEAKIERALQWVNDV